MKLDGRGFFYEGKLEEIGEQLEFILGMEGQWKIQRQDRLIFLQLNYGFWDGGGGGYGGGGDS